MKTRLLGAAVLIALAVLFVPMFFSSNPPPAAGDQSVSLDIPAAPDRDLQTQTMSLAPGASVPPPPPAPGAAQPPQAQPSAASPSPATGGNALATVNIASNRPRDVETDPAAGKPSGQTTVTRPGAAAPSPSQPLIPAQPRGGSPTPAPRQPEARTPQPAPPAAAPASAPPATAVAAHGHYTINLSAYASAASAQSLAQRVRGLGYPVSSRPISQAGKPLTLVTAGPFESRAAAESARLKITQAIPGAPARIGGSANDQQGDEPAPVPRAAASASASRAGGWAVQVAAVGSQADANALRDKLRGSGFDGFVDSVNAGGKQLWRVRAGPQTQREDAVRLRDQIKAKLGLSGNVVSMP